MIEKLMNVGIADIQSTDEANKVLRTILGSCVGICLYDPRSRLGGMAHIMLPDQREEEGNALKYADSAIPLLVEQMRELGGEPKRFEAKIAGGASMFEVADSKNSFMADIGKKNVQRVREVLQSLGIKVVAEDVGGTKGRTIDLYIADGRLRIKKFGSKEEFL